MEARHGPRAALERAMGRLVATAGIIGIGTGLGALLVSNKVQGWLTGLVVAVVSIVLTVLLRRS
jgi:ribose 5-phosphate isomerase RpiB